MTAPANCAASLLRNSRVSLLPSLRVSSRTNQPCSVTVGARRWNSSSSTTSPLPSDASAANHCSSSSSVNPDEISHFNALAATWWDPHGSSRILHLMNPLRHDFIRECHTSQPDPYLANQKLRYLDIGCGGGIFAESAARLPTTESVTAIDPSPEVLAIAQRHARKDPAVHPETNPGRLTYLNATIETLPMPAELYDVVSVFEVVEHVDNPGTFLERCGQFVRPGGWLVLSTMARTWMSWFTTNLVAEDILGVVPKGTHDWRKYINEEELRSYFARQSGWSSPRVMGVVYIPGLGWKEVTGSEKIGNYFFAIRKHR